MIRFPQGQADLTPDEAQWIEKAAPSMRDDPEQFTLALVAIVNPNEGEQAQALAQRRAEVVRDALVNYGAPSSRVTIADTEPGVRSVVVLRPVLDPPE